MQKPLEPLRCLEKVNLSAGSDVHAGWIRATTILLRGLERLHSQNNHSSGKEE